MENIGFAVPDGNKQNVIRAIAWKYGGLDLSIDEGGIITINTPEGQTEAQYVRSCFKIAMQNISNSSRRGLMDKKARAITTYTPIQHEDVEP